MTELPNRCICGYQGKIDRLETECNLLRGDIERLEQQFVIVEDSRDHWRNKANRVDTEIEGVL